MAQSATTPDEARVNQIPPAVRMAVAQHVDDYWVVGFRSATEYDGAQLVTRRIDRDERLALEADDRVKVGGMTACDEGFRVHIHDTSGV